MKQSKRWLLWMLVVCLFLAMGPKAFAAEDRAMGKAGIEIEKPEFQLQPMDRTDPPTAFGIDVSHHQGTIDWDTVASQIDFAIIRCGYGDNITSQDDRQWYRNVQECTRLGIPFGVYIYSYALTESEARSEADHVLRLLEGYYPTLPVYYDLEDKTILENCSTDQILNITRTFCEKIEAAGYRAGVYANYNWWTTYLTSSEYDRWDRWIARYAGATGYSKNYTIWQYSDKGQINGISGNVDLNHWYGPLLPDTPVNLGDVFTAPILNNAHWKIIENNNGNVQTANETGKSNQLWRFERQSDGSYKIFSCYDGKCLDVADASNQSGATVWMWESNDSDAQRWYIYEESGGYVLRAKCTECVLDLPNNDPANGNRLQMYTKNGSGAQIWAIYRGDECVMKGPTLSVNVGSAASGTTFTWNDVYGETQYDLKIWRDTLWEGDAYHVAWNASSGYSLTLPAGTYHAYVDAGNYFELKMGNVVTFTVNPGSYTISYHANGGSGAPSSQTKTHGTNLTLSTTVPTRFGYSFLGWATSSSATSPNYYSGDTYTANSGATLYAVWGAAEELSGDYCNYIRRPSIHNGGAGVYYKFIPNATTNYRIFGTGDVDTVLYLYDASGNQLDYNDDGGSNRQFFLERSFTKDTTYYLYVKFYGSSQTGSLPFTIEKRYSISYNANGGSGAPATQYKYGDESTTLSTVIPVLSGHDFLGWATSNTAETAEYQPGDTYSRNSNVTLYAVWRANSYTIRYDANGGSGAPASQTKPAGQEIMISSTRPDRFGYTFKGWALSASATAVAYRPGSDFDLDADTTLYAVWAAAETITTTTEAVKNPMCAFGSTEHYYKLVPGVSTSYRINLWDSDPQSRVSLTILDENQNVLARITGDDAEAASQFDVTLEYPVTSGRTYYLCLEFYDTDQNGVYLIISRGYQISYSANGGSGAPASEYHYYGSGPYRISTKTPVRTGYTFAGWNTRADGSGNTYAAGSNLDEDWGDYTLYAIWERGCSDSHSYSYSVTKNPTTSATGTLTGTCSKCSGTTTVTLPRLNTTDYSYAVTKAAECETDGAGRYTWRTTSYGSYSFNVTIAATGHDYEDGSCIHCGRGDPSIFDSEIASGWSGYVQWTLTSDGVLTVYGKGNMKNYGYEGGQPWAGYADQITSVVIKPGVTSVGDCAFKGLTKLENVSLPSNGLTKIGEAAFYGCTSLVSVYIPEGIYTIWSYTFKNCTSLMEISMPRSLIKIDQGAFENCTTLPYVYIPTEVEIIGSWSFKGCTGLEEVDMEWADATKIREGAFKNCSALTTIHLPANIQTLGDSCFYGIGATSFTVPDTVTSIEAWCFARANLKSITFQGNAPTIGQGAFNKITLTAYYPKNNSTWTSAVKQNYGGTVTWKAN